MSQETVHPDWAKLKESFRFQVYDPQIRRARFDQQRWDSNAILRRIVERSDPLKRDLPVYYPGSGSDIAYPLVTTNASRFVFVDYLYIDNWGTPGMDAMEGLITQELPEIGALIRSDRLVGVLGQRGKRVVKFDWAGKERELTLYAEDATKFTPKEIRNGILSAIVKAPTQAPRSAEGKVPGPLYVPEFRIRMYQQVAVEGFINWRPVNYLQPEMAGFEATNPDERYTSYQKIRELPGIKSIIRIDNLLMMSISLRDGTLTGDISGEFLNHQFRRDMRQLRRLYLLLDSEGQAAILPSLQEYLAPTEVSVDYLDTLARLGEDQGIDTQDKALDYIRGSIGIFLDNFPELQVE